MGWFTKHDRELPVGVGWLDAGACEGGQGSYGKYLERGNSLIVDCDTRHVSSSTIAADEEVSEIGRNRCEGWSWQAICEYVAVSKRFVYRQQNGLVFHISLRIS